MDNHNDFDDFDTLESYGDLGYITEYRKLVDERNSHKLKQLQFKLIKEQQQEIINNRKSSKRSQIIAIFSAIIASVSLIVSIITLLINSFLS